MNRPRRYSTTTLHGNVALMQCNLVGRCNAGELSTSVVGDDRGRRRRTGGRLDGLHEQDGAGSSGASSRESGDDLRAVEALGAECTNELFG